MCHYTIPHYSATFNLSDSSTTQSPAVPVPQHDDQAFPQEGGSGPPPGADPPPKPAKTAFLISRYWADPFGLHRLGREGALVTTLEIEPTASETLVQPYLLAESCIGIPCPRL